MSGLKFYFLLAINLNFLIRIGTLNVDDVTELDLLLNNTIENTDVDISPVSRIIHRQAVNPQVVIQKPTPPPPIFTCPGIGLFANPNDCRTYYSCQAGQTPQQLRCPPQLFWDQKTKTCKDSASADCGGFLRPPPPQPTPAPFVCVGIGLFANPGDCRQYYSCSQPGAIGIKLQCPVGAYWDQPTRTCRGPAEADCGGYSKPVLPPPLVITTRPTYIYASKPKPWRPRLCYYVCPSSIRSDIDSFGDTSQLQETSEQPFEVRSQEEQLDTTTDVEVNERCHGKSCKPSKWKPVVQVAKPAVIVEQRPPQTVYIEQVQKPVVVAKPGISISPVINVNPQLWLASWLCHC